MMKWNVLNYEEGGSPVLLGEIVQPAGRAGCVRLDMDGRSRLFFSVFQALNEVRRQWPAAYLEVV